MNLAYLDFLCVTLLIDAFSSDPFLLKISVPPEKKQFFCLSWSLKNKTKQNKDSLMFKDAEKSKIWKKKNQLFHD